MDLIWWDDPEKVSARPKKARQVKRRPRLPPAALRRAARWGVASVRDLLTPGVPNFVAPLMAATPCPVVLVREGGVSPLIRVTENMNKERIIRR